MLSHIHRKIGSLLGLLAILMATLAPTVSQVVATHRHADTFANILCSAQSTADDATGSQSSPHSSHSVMSHGDACGYCSLLAHLPLMPCIQAPFAVTVWAIQQRVTARFASVRRTETPTAAQPRAPPVLI
jgi:Protein of unknown function (DUF2946)